ncbi:type IV pilus biogenesis/stability protein PilW [Legionella spiritensis]|uniref:Fimbrial biogenesis and twitching motility protein PilF n=1 Tax=Legionella spiritensis TaxID=452 RepID=A0A0W0YXW7_LEGSP|nr:type IV pilus biogenesis/stability protein PilW [Legionella spiritensis]KTD61675.1 fimbrial biogenesis and twitching motility protein PilF [Legionella spiritensis]SNV38999.1 type IV pilus assembly protein PilF [Legionella spiritensis]VEG90312.1 type IV pilus assembly protein PilF [Legionella spiritensis]
MGRRSGWKQIGWLASLCVFLLLQACQHSLETERKKQVKEQKLSKAAGYNTQLGLAYLKQGDTPRAKRKLLYALQMEPNSPDVNVAMAYFLEKTGDVDEAKNYYSKALSLAPNDGSQLNNYGTFLCRSGKYKEAERYFLKAVNDVHYIHSAGAYENAGLCASAIPDLAKAEHYFTKALEQDPHRRQSLVELVTLEIKQNDPSKALKILQKYQEMALNDPSLLALAVDAAHKAEKADMEDFYKQRLGRFTNNVAGEKNDYEHNSNG